MRPVHHNKRWLKPTEAVEMFGYTRQTIRRWALEGKVRSRINQNCPPRGTNGWGMEFDRRDIEKLLGYEN